MPEPPKDCLLVDVPAEIRGDGFLLRVERAGDGPAFFEAVEESRADFRPWLEWVDRLRSVEDAERGVRRIQIRWLSRERLAYGIFDAAGVRLLGGAALEHPDWSVPSFELGYWLRSSEQRKGLATAAVRLLCRM